MLDSPNRTILSPQNAPCVKKGPKSRGQAIRLFCAWCQGWTGPGKVGSDIVRAVVNCLSPKCELYPFRTGRGGGAKSAAIRRYCRECVGDVYEDLVECTGVDCLLYQWRLGRIQTKSASSNKKAADVAAIHSED